MKAVNLLPSEEAGGRGRRLDPLAVGGIVVTVVVAAAVAGGYLLEHGHAKTASQQLAVARSQLANAKAQHESAPPAHATAPALTTPSVTAQEQTWRDAVASALSTRIAWDRVLHEFSQVIPSDITVSSLTMGAPSASSSGSSGATGAFTLAGQAFSEDGVARLLSRLMLVPDLSGAALQNSTANPKTGVVSFQIQAQMKGASAPAASSTSAAPTTGTTTTGTTTTGTTTTGSSG